MAKSWPPKDPDEVLDYSINWGLDDEGNPGRLPVADDQIATSTWDVPIGITKDSATFSSITNVATIWLSGGTLGETYVLTNHIVSTDGRSMDQSVRIKIKAK